MVAFTAVVQFAWSRPKHISPGSLNIHTDIFTIESEDAKQKDMYSVTTWLYSFNNVHSEIKKKLQNFQNNGVLN